MIETESQRVRSYSPAARHPAVMRIGNAVMVPVLRSRMGARIRELGLLTYTGRRTGKRYTIPVGMYALGGDLVVLTASKWRVNLRGGTDVEVMHEGRRRKMHAEVIDEADEVARVYGTLLRRIGVRKAAHLGLKVEGDAMPTHDEMVHAVEGVRSVVRLTPLGG